MTLVPVVEESPPAGDQTYVVPPDAVNVAEPPAQMVGEFTLITGLGVTVTVEVVVPEQPAVVPTTV